MSNSKMAFQEKSLDRGWVGGVSSIQFLCVDFWMCYNSSKPLILSVITKTMASRTITITSEGNIDIEPHWPQPYLQTSKTTSRKLSKITTWHQAMHLRRRPRLQTRLIPRRLLVARHEASWHQAQLFSSCQSESFRTMVSHLLVRRGQCRCQHTAKRRNNSDV